MKFEDVRFYEVRHGGDVIYAFDLTDIYHGYTRENPRDFNPQTNFNVYDDRNNNYQSYNLTDFKIFLQSLNGAVINQFTNQIQKYFEVNKQQVLIGVGLLAVLGITLYMVNKK